ncbi:glycosyltransferase family 4 protein [Marinoscillum sp.]|uniref:glycosyltransferase family 4 protein n=1 Tax=Marinoscillum sp. TaxID=2024838 RepID=UPI003BA8A9D0
MKILFTTCQGGVAGSTHSIYYLIRGLSQKGHEIHLACGKGALLWNLVSGLGNVYCHDVPFDSYLDFGSVRSIVRVIKKHQIELINAQGGKDRNLTILAKWAFALDVKIVFTRRQRPRNEPWIKRWFHTTGTSGIVMVSEGLKDIFLKKGYREAHLKVIFNGVPRDLLLQVSKERVEGLRGVHGLVGKTICCVSRKKLQGELIEALKYLPEDYNILFVGIAQEDFALLLARERPKQRIIFTGVVSHELALHYLQLADVNILPSHMDGFGLALVEAMLCRVAVIGSRFGGIPDIIQDGVNGFLFNNREPEDLAMKIQRLVESQTLRKRFADKAFKDATQKFLVERTVLEYEAYFRRLVG